MRKLNVFVGFVFCFLSLCNAQTKKVDTSIDTISLLEKKIIRLNVLSPGFGVELRTGKFSSFNLSSGVTYMGRAEGMNVRRKSGPWFYSFEPFLGVEQKFFYNLKKRADKGKNISYNSANFISLRFLTTGEPIEGNLIRQSDYDFVFLVTWGIQRSYNRIHFLVDIGPHYIFDSKGNSDFYPVMIRLNLGYNF